MAQMMGAQGMEVGSVGRIGHGMGIQKATGISSWAKGSTRGRRNGGAVHIHAWVLFLPFSASVLEPDLNLRRNNNI